MASAEVVLQRHGTATATASAGGEELSQLEADEAFARRLQAQEMGFSMPVLSPRATQHSATQPQCCTRVTTLFACVCVCDGLASCCHQTHNRRANTGGGGGGAGGGGIRMNIANNVLQNQVVARPSGRGTVWFAYPPSFSLSRCSTSGDFV